MLLVVLALAAGNGFAQNPLPWQKWVEVPDPAYTKRLDSIFDLKWNNSGGPEGELAVADAAKLPGAPFPGKLFDFKVKVDHFNAGQYPIGWPSFESRPAAGTVDWHGYEAICYWIRCDTKVTGALPIRFILWTNNEGRINELLPTFKAGEWVPVTHRISAIPDLDKVDRIHFFISESEYKDKDELDFQIGGFELCNLKREIAPFPDKDIAAGLWLGERADKNDNAVILDQGTKTVPALMVIQAGTKASLREDDEVRVRFHEVFSGKDTVRTSKLGREVSAVQVARVETKLDTSGLAPGYYLVVADVRRGGKSLLGGRVGSDDLYIRKAGESMTYTVLSLRTGMVMWCRDQLYGDIMGNTRVALPHVYDPLDKVTFPEFVSLMAGSGSSGTQAEGNEAGDTGLALAAEAFCKAGDMTRCKFAEWLLDSSYDHMIAKMQAPSGATIAWSNELADNGVGSDSARSEAFGGTYNPDQIGEWMRAITYGIIYYSRIPEKREYAEKLSAAVRKAADYVVAHSLMDSDGMPNVIRHVSIVERPDGTFEQFLNHQEGRQCDVYLGRVLSGLSYYAYAMQLLGEKVPEKWWPIMDETVKWSAQKMKPNGWFDWQCGDVVEGGCHTFLGNIYIGEGLFGCYLADKLAGRTEAAAEAVAAAHKAYRYVTDDCWIKGKQYTASGATEFWVGPYMYWLFSEWADTVGHDEKIVGWNRDLDRIWRVERKWRDFIGRPCPDPVGRSDGNGMLTVSILGYLGLRQMAEMSKPLGWRVR
jgi:hypothetical protein